MNQFIVVATAVALTIIVVFCQIRYLSPKPKPTYSQLNVGTIKNGDLLFLCGTTQGEKIIRWYTNSPFSHVAMLFVEDEKVYVWECDLGQKYKAGTRVMALSDKLERWKGLKIGGIKRLNTKHPSTENILKLVEKYKNVDFDNKMYRWLFSNFITIKDKHMFCTELIATTLQELHVIDDKKTPVEHSPTDFLNDENNYMPLETFSF